jgi:hemoglobin
VSETAEVLPTREDIKAVVTTFYGRARLDPLIGPVFARVVHDWDAHIETLTDFWMSAAYGAGIYRGRPMPAHMRLGLDRHMFGRWLELWFETTGEVLGEARALILRERALKIAEAFQAMLALKD